MKTSSPGGRDDGVDVDPEEIDQGDEIQDLSVGGPIDGGHPAHGADEPEDEGNGESLAGLLGLVGAEHDEADEAEEDEDEHAGDGSFAEIIGLDGRDAGDADDADDADGSTLAALLGLDGADSEDARARDGRQNDHDQTAVDNDLSHEADEVTMPMIDIIEEDNGQSLVRALDNGTSYYTPTDGVGFTVNSAAIPSGEVPRLLLLNPELDETMRHPDTLIVIQGNASRPGTEAHNHQLSLRRADALRRELVEYGAKAEIRVVAAGERAHRSSSPVLMSGEEPSDGDIRDRIEDARFRTAVISAFPQASVATYEAQAPPSLTSDDIQREVSSGRAVFETTIAREFGGWIVREMPMPENPVGPKDMIDIKGLVTRAGPGMKLWDLGKGIMYDIFMDSERVRVKEARDAKFRAVAEGVAAGIDEAYAESMTWEPQDALERDLFERSGDAARGLSETEQEQLAWFLAAYTDSDSTTVNDLADAATGSSLRASIRAWFNLNFDYSRRNGPG